MKFTKMEGCGNDYIYVDARSLDVDWPAYARSMSDRHFGIGSDGLILILQSTIADFKMRMFNADGSEGEMCGNGVRCFAKYTIDRGLVNPSKGEMVIETMGGLRTVFPLLHNGNVVGARVAMGPPRLAPPEIPVLVDDLLGDKAGSAVINYPLTVQHTDLRLTFVSMGNPHAVAFIDQPVNQFPLQSIGPEIENHPMFPSRTNFEIVNVAGAGKMNARVWERGSGETLACGTGACAIAVAAHLCGIADGRVDINDKATDINLPGGTLKVMWDGRGEVYLEGPAVEVFQGEWSA